MSDTKLRLAELRSQNLAARAKQGAGDIARAIDQRRGVGLVGKCGGEGVVGPARLGKGLASAALCDRVGCHRLRRSERAASRSRSRRLNAHAAKIGLRGGLGLSARSDCRGLRLRPSRPLPSLRATLRLRRPKLGGTATGEPGGPPRSMTLPPLHSVAVVVLMPTVPCIPPPGQHRCHRRPARSQADDPAAAPVGARQRRRRARSVPPPGRASSMLLAKLYVEPGKPPESMTLPSPPLGGRKRRQCWWRRYRTARPASEIDAVGAAPARWSQSALRIGPLRRRSRSRGCIGHAPHPRSHRAEQTAAKMAESERPAKRHRALPECNGAAARSPQPADEIPRSATSCARKPRPRLPSWLRAMPPQHTSALDFSRFPLARNLTTS